MTILLLYKFDKWTKVPDPDFCYRQDGLWKVQSKDKGDAIKSPKRVI